MLFKTAEGVMAISSLGKSIYVFMSDGSVLWFDPMSPAGDRTRTIQMFQNPGFAGHQDSEGMWFFGGDYDVCRIIHDFKHNPEDWDLEDRSDEWPYSNPPRYMTISSDKKTVVAMGIQGMRCWREGNPFSHRSFFPELGDQVAFNVVITPDDHVIADIGNGRLLMMDSGLSEIDTLTYEGSSVSYMKGK